MHNLRSSIYSVGVRRKGLFVVPGVERIAQGLFVEVLERNDRHSITAREQPSYCALANRCAHGAASQETGDYGETDSDNDLDSTTQAGASGPGPPDRVCGGGAARCSPQNSASKEPASSQERRPVLGAGGNGDAGAEGGRGSRPGAVTVAKQACAAGVQELLVPPPKARLDRIKAEAKEVK